MSREESLKLIGSYDSMDILQWEDDEVSLNWAAETSALSPSELSVLEKNFFGDVVASREVTLLYLFIRNKILQLWHTSPVVELSLERVQEQLSPPYNCDAALTTRIFGFLKRYGYINHGVFTLEKGVTNGTVKTVIIIGAGIAGIAAARQLKYFGIESRILEARGRIGGRISTYKKPDVDTVADLGGMFIMGLNRNPICDLLKQVKMTLKDCKTSIVPIYDPKEGLVPLKAMVMLERCFNKLLKTAFCIENMNKPELGSISDMNLEELIDMLLMREDYELQLRREKLYVQQVEYLEQMKRDEESMLILKEALLKKHLQLEAMRSQYEKSSETADDGIQLEIAIKCNEKDIRDMVEKYDICKKRFEDYDVKLSELRRSGVTEVFMNKSDRKKFNFYLACLELASGAPASMCSAKLSHLECSKRPFGTCVCVSEGMSVLTDKLAQDLDIQTNCRVYSVSYSSQGVKVGVEYQNNFKKEVSEVVGDVCLCTLPLGILKGSGCLRFDPPLPDWKTQALSLLGYGNICKVILIFEQRFWKTPMFGRLNDGDRGYLHLFYGLYDTPVLIGVICGEAAYKIDRIENPDVIVEDAMRLLKEIFNDECPNEPKDAVVARWGNDPYARGSNAYFTPGCKGDEPERIAAPLEDKTGVPRLFFAGEHTSTDFLGTIHGAYLSGVYSAALIADQFLGCNFEKTE